MQRFAGFFFIILAALLWGGIGPVSRFALAAGVTPLEIAFWRGVFGFAFFGLHALLSGAWRVRPRDVAPLMLFGLVGITCFFGSYQVAVNEGGAALASILLYTAPAWVAVMSRLFFGEALTRRKLAALGVAMLGTLLISLSGGSLDGNRPGYLAVFMGLLSGFTYACHYIFCRRYLRDYSAVTLYFYCLPLGILGLLPLFDFSPLPLTDVQTGGVYLFLGAFATYGAYFVYCEALKRLSPTRVAVTANLEPVIAAVFAYLWWGELFSTAGFAGAALVLAAVILMVTERIKA